MNLPWTTLGGPALPLSLVTMPHQWTQICTDRNVFGPNWVILGLCNLCLSHPDVGAGSKCVLGALEGRDMSLSSMAARNGPTQRRTYLLISKEGFCVHLSPECFPEFTNPQSTQLGNSVQWDISTCALMCECGWARGNGARRARGRSVSRMCQADLAVDVTLA